MFARLTGRLWVFTVAIVLLGGCTGGRAPSDDEKPCDEGKRASPWAFNESVPFKRGNTNIPSVFVEGYMTHFLLGHHASASTMGPPATPVYVVTANMTSKMWTQADVAAAELSFAARGPIEAYAMNETLWVTINLNRDGPDGRPVDEWVNFASFEKGVWTVEPQPDRWRGQAAIGIVRLGESTYVLTWHRRPPSWSVWKNSDGAWTEEGLGLSGLKGAEIATNGTHLFVAGTETNGDTVLLHRGAADSKFEKEILQPGSLMDIQGGVMISSTHGRTPTVLWSKVTLDPAESGGIRVQRFFSQFRDGAWKVEALPVMNDTVTDLASTLTADYVIAKASNHNELWRRNETAWNRCQIGNDFWPDAVGLVHNATSAMLVFVPIGPEYRARAVMLDNYSATCVPSGVRPLPWKP